MKSVEVDAVNSPRPAKAVLFIGGTLLLFYVQHFLVDGIALTRLFLMMMMLALAWEIKKNVRVWWSIVSHRAVVPFLGFLAYYGASGFWNEGNTLLDSLDIVKTVFYLLVASMASIWVVLNWPRWPTLFLYAVVIAGGACSVVALYLNYPLIISGYRFEGIGTLDYPIEYALGCCFVALILLHYFLQTKKSYYFLLMVVFFVLASLTYTRGVLGGFGLGVATYLLLNRRVKFTDVKTLVVVLILLALIVGALGYSVDKRGWKPSCRESLWTEALQKVGESPVIGVGLSKKEELHCGIHSYPHSHNNVLEVLRYGGALGLLLFMSVLLSTFLGVRKLEDGDGEISFWASVLVFGLACGFTNGRFIEMGPIPEWMVVWLPLIILISFSVRESLDEESLISRA